MEFTRITVDPHQMGGVPCIRRLRIPVATIVDMVADELGVAEILRCYPDLETEDVREALRYAAEAVRERDLPLVSARRENATTFTADEARQIAEEWRERFKGRVTSDSGELIREDRDR